MTPNPRAQLTDLTHKYLKYLESQKSVSLLTSKSYATDLQQFLETVKRLLEDNSSISESFCWQSPTAKSADLAPFWNEVNLLHVATQSQLSWSGLKKSSRNRKTATLKSFFRWLYEVESVLERPIHHRLKAPKPDLKVPRFLSVDEALVVLETAQQWAFEEPSKGSPALLLFLLLYGSGLRISEATQLKWSDLDLAERRVLIAHGKGQTQRVVTLQKLAATELARQPRQTAYVFGEAPLSTRVAYNWIRNLGIRSGLQAPLNPHALRHSFATHLLVGGLDLRRLQEALGHRTLQATEKYTHLDLKDLAASLENCHPLGKTKGSL